MCLLSAFLAFLALVSGTPSVHPTSLSHLLLRFDQDFITLELRMQELTLREVQRWSLDSDASGRISNHELEAQWDGIAGLLEKSLWLEFNGEIYPLSFSIIDYPGETHRNPDGSFDFSHVLVQARIPRPATLLDPKVHSDLFLDDGNPYHNLHITVTGLEGADRLYLLRWDEREYLIHVPNSLEVLGQYIGLGWEHVLEGYDHLAFLIALLFGVASFRHLLGAVTAFTLAHSITLALAALDIVRLPPSLVEPGIAFSVLAVLILHLRRPATDAKPWIPAFGFGLLHGFGFAGVLGEIGIPPGDRTVSLLGFNLGVEAGQLTFVIPVAMAGFLLSSRLSPSAWRRCREWLALPTLAFAMFLVGNSSLSYYFGNFAELSGRFTLLGVGCGSALLLSLLPGGLAETVRRQRILVAQAALLLTCFSAGQFLRG